MAPLLIRTHAMGLFYKFKAKLLIFAPNKIQYFTYFKTTING